MAKVTGPLLSLDASGSVANTITFSKWKGINYLRQRVVPSNPKTAGQKTARSIFGVLAKAAHSVLTSYADSLGAGSAFFQDARDAAPSGNSWISYFQKNSNADYDTRRTAYLALSSTIRGYYDTGASTMNLSSYVDKSGNTHTTGEQLYMLAWFAVTYLGYTFTGGINAPASQTPVNALRDYVIVSN